MKGIYKIRVTVFIGSTVFLSACNSASKEQSEVTHIEPTEELINENVPYNSPDSISGTTMVYSINTSTITINYKEVAYEDIAHNWIRYNYEKTGDKTATLISYMNEVYPVQQDLKYLLTFNSKNEGSFTYVEGNKSGTFFIKD